MSQTEPAWEVEFVLDTDNGIARVGGAWDRFARDNDAPDLGGAAVTGKPLLDFISGKVTRAYLLRLIDRVCVGGEPIELDYRCDSPETRRFMRMRISEQAGGGLLFQHRLLRAEQRTVPVHFYRPAEPIRGCHVRCSMCNLIQVGDVWGEAESLLPVRELRKAVAVIYGVCQACQQKIEPQAMPAG
mgnify:CR=1 FL=1